MKIKVIQYEDEFTELFIFTDIDGIKHIIHPVEIKKGLGL